jgi:hypothetical protein
MTATDSTTPRATPPAAGRSHPDVSPLTPGLVTTLQTLEGYPAVSLLLSTTAAEKMLPDDAARLTALAREAEQRLESESLTGVRRTVLGPLTELVATVAEGPADAAVGVFVSATTATAVHLPVPVKDRAVVDPTFATRDLVRALHRTPRHVVLALGLDEARLFDVIGADVRPAPGRSFPRKAAGSGSAPGPGEDGHRQAGHGRQRHGRQRDDRPQQRRAFLRDVDRALGAYLSLHPAPLVLVGTDRVLAEFRQISGNLGRLAGSVHGSMLTAPTADLVARIQPVLTGYLRSRQAEALALLDRRTGANRVAVGIDSAWLAARTERPEMLAVEEGFFYPARLDAGGDLLVPAADVEHPEVIDDVVDELIEAVLRRGGWVALVEDGGLADRGRVALTLRA